MFVNNRVSTNTPADRHFDSHPLVLWQAAGQWRPTDGADDAFEGNPGASVE